LAVQQKAGEPAGPLPFEPSGGRPVLAIVAPTTQ
jgi:hypothetical protein